MADFTGAAIRGSVDRWLNKGRLPIGIYLLKLRFFLEALGFKIRELSMLDPVIYSFAKAIAYNSIDLDQALELTKLSDRSGVLRIVLARQSTSQDRLRLMEEVVSKHKKDVELAEATLLKKLQFKQKAVSETRAFTLPEPPISSSDKYKEEIIGVTANLAKTMLVLANLIDSENFSASDRGRLREQSGKNTIFLLKNVLTHLCGERARENFRQENGGGNE